MWFHVSLRYQEECDFKMYTKCSSLSDPLNNGAHKHPRQRGKCFKCSFHLKSKSATPVLVKCKFDTHPLTVHYSQLFPRTRGR